MTGIFWSFQSDRKISPSVVFSYMHIIIVPKEIQTKLRGGRQGAAQPCCLSHTVSSDPKGLVYTLPDVLPGGHDVEKASPIWGLQVWEREGKPI